MHDGMQYDPIQGQCHEPSKVGNSTIFKSYLLPASFILFGEILNRTNKQK